MKVVVRKGSGPQTLTTGTVVVELHLTLEQAHEVRHNGVVDDLNDMLDDCLDEHFPTRLTVQRVRQTLFGHRNS